MNAFNKAITVFFNSDLLSINVRLFYFLLLGPLLLFLIFFLNFARENLLLQLWKDVPIIVVDNSILQFCRALMTKSLRKGVLLGCGL